MRKFNKIDVIPRYISAVLYVFILFVTLSCNKQDAPLSKEFSGTKGSISLNIRSANAANDETITKVRIIAFTADGKLVANELHDVSSQTAAPYRIDAVVAEGENNLYIVCNETPQMMAKLSEVETTTALEAITYSDYGTTPPLSMFGRVPKLIIKIDGEKNVTAEVDGAIVSTVDAEVTRTMAKLSVMVIKKTHLNHEFSVEELSYKICRMPRYSFLLGGKTYPQDEGWRDEIKVLGTGRLSIEGEGEYVSDGNGGYKAGAGVDFITTPEVYIPEHLPTSKQHPDYCTYLLIEAKCKIEGNPSTVNIEYKLDIGNNPPVDNYLERNTHYRIYVTIKSLGAMGFYAEIVPVNEVNIPINWKPFEGYVIVSEKATEYNKDNNIWNDYSQYHGILKIVKNKVYQNALFRYGSVVALSDAASAAAFNPTSDVIWRPTVDTSPITAWGDVSYVSTDADTEIVHNPTTVAQGKGDPCRLVGLTDEEIAAGEIDNDLWRMPTAAEMQWLLTAQNSLEEASSLTNAGKGFYSFHYLLTPNSGYRSSADGVMNPATTNGYYWSSTNKKAFIFNSATNTGAETSTDRGEAYAIRCIRTTIHPSRLAVADMINISYSGVSNQLADIKDRYNTPFWKMSVNPETDFTFIKARGSSSESGIYNILQLPNVYTPRKYTLTTTGYGLDGKVNVVNSTITQHLLTHAIVITLTTTGLSEEVGYLRIPATGAKLSFKIEISPYPFPPYDINFNSKKWHVTCKYHDTEPRYLHGTDVEYGGISEVTIPENNYPHAVSYEFYFTPFSISEYPPHNSFSSIPGYNAVLIQEKK